MAVHISYEKQEFPNNKIVTCNIHGISPDIMSMLPSCHLGDATMHFLSENVPSQLRNRLAKIIVPEKAQEFTAWARHTSCNCVGVCVGVCLGY